MTRRHLKNVAASVRDRLLARSRETGEEAEANILEKEIVALFSEITGQRLIMSSNINGCQHFDLDGSHRLCSWHA